MIFNRETLQIVNGIEIKFPVDKWEIDSLHIWPWVRLMLMRQEAGDTRPRNRKKISLFGRIAESLKYRLKKIRSRTKYGLIQINRQKIKADAEIIFQSFLNKRMLFDNLLLDQHCDPIIDYLRSKGIKSLLLEQTDRLDIDDLARKNSENVVQEDYLISVFLTQHQDELENTEMMKVELPQYDAFIKYLGKELPQISIENFGKEKIKKEIKRILVLKEFFLDILQKNKNVKACFIVCYYHMQGIALILAAREMGIQTIDLQHGCQYHTAYSRWNKIPKEGYEMLPDIFWNWDQNHAEDINKWAINSGGHHRAFVGGYPWLQIWMDKKSPIIKFYNQKLEKLIDPEKVKILFTLNAMPEPIPSAIMETINQSPDNWFWFIRPHPIQRSTANKLQEDLYKVCSPKKCRVQTEFDIPLPAILQYVDIHATTTSSSILEAESFGVPSVATEKDAVTTYPDQISNGILKYADNPQKIIEAIKFQLSLRKNIRTSQSLDQKYIQLIIDHFLTGNFDLK